MRSEYSNRRLQKKALIQQITMKAILVNDDKLSVIRFVFIAVATACGFLGVFCHKSD